MSITHTILGLAVGIAMGTMDFTLAKSLATITRLVSPRTARAILVSGFIFRIGAITVLLWAISRASNISFIAVCVGLLAAFTILALAHTIKTYAGTVQIQKQLSSRR